MLGDTDALVYDFGSIHRLPITFYMCCPSPTSAFSVSIFPRYIDSPTQVLSDMAASGKSLSGRTCLVTGGARGLGKSVTLKLLDSGARVVVCDIDKDLLDSVSAEYSKRGQTMQVQCDVTDASAVKSLVQDAVKHFGRLDVLVHCAGIVDRFDPIGDVSQDLWEKVLAVNLTGTFLLCKEVLNHFLSRCATDASIVNIGSLSSECGWAAGKYQC